MSHEKEVKLIITNVSCQPIVCRKLMLSTSNLSLTSTKDIFISNNFASTPLLMRGLIHSKKRQKWLVVSIDPLLWVACISNQFLWFEPQIDFILGGFWTITPMDDVSTWQTTKVRSWKQSNEQCMHVEGKSTTVTRPMIILLTNTRAQLLFATLQWEIVTLMANITSNKTRSQIG